ncbi:MAG: DNA repair protein RadA [Actinomycetota bacterium]|nr:DNA repair protein RadA [Actinomycetota bacterium]
MSPRERVVWRCQQCGASAPRWTGRCAECGEYGTYVEESETVLKSSSRRADGAAPVVLGDITEQLDERRPTGIQEFDRVLGGGLVLGSLTLLGGEPGIGKSTLLLQVTGRISSAGADVLYVCGEESPAQVSMRARRLGIDGGRLSLLPEVDIAVVEAVVRKSRPDLLVVDSIQTVFDPELSGAPGSVGQVRAATARLMRLAKDLGVTTLIVGHVTKEGAIAGPRVLEHMVDTVLYFEGDSDHAFRVVRAVKNRFGATNEVGIFEMVEEGLIGVGQPSSALLAERVEVAGSIVMAAVEGARPILLEIQALVTPTYLPVPRRLATGIDSARLMQVLAVLERRANQSFAGQDVFVSVSGGLRVAEPAVDLPLALALVSALVDRPAPLGIAAFGEIGLTGQIRGVPHAETRLREAEHLGFTRVMGPPPRAGRGTSDILEAVSSISEAAALLYS